MIECEWPTWENSAKFGLANNAACPNNSWHRSISIQNNMKQKVAKFVHVNI